MSSLSGQHLCSQSFPYLNRKFVDRREGGNEGDARRAGDSDIKFFSHPFIRNISNTFRKAGGAFYLRFRFWLACAQETFGQRFCDECPGSDPGLQIAFPCSFSKAIFTVSLEIPRSAASAREDGSREELSLKLPETNSSRI